MNSEECFIVVKSGNSTSDTLGHLTGIESFVRECAYYGICSTSMELDTYSYSHRDSVCSAWGFRVCPIVGILTGSASRTDPIDITYAYHWNEEYIKDAFPNSHLYPILAQTVALIHDDTGDAGKADLFLFFFILPMRLPLLSSCSCIFELVVAADGYFDVDCCLGSSPSFPLNSSYN